MITKDMIDKIKKNLNNSMNQQQRPSQSNVMNFLVNSNFFTGRNNKRELTTVSGAPSLVMSNLAQIDQSSSIEMENSINSIIKDMIETNQINENNNINSNNVNNVNNVEIFKSETIIDDFRNNITKQLNNIEEEDKKQSRFRKRKNSQNEIEIKNLKRNNGLIIEGISITKCITNP